MTKYFSMGAGQIFNFILKCHCTDDFSRQVARHFLATAKVVGTRQIKNLSCTLFNLFWFFDKSRDCSFFCLAIVRPLRKG